MELLLVTKNQVSPGETAATGSTLKGFFVGVGPLVAFQVLQTGEASSTDLADMGSRFICSDLEGFFGDRLGGPTVGRNRRRATFGRRVCKHRIAVSGKGLLGLLGVACMWWRIQAVVQRGNKDETMAQV